MNEEKDLTTTVDHLSDDFDLSDSGIEQDSNAELGTDVEEPTAEEIEEWANVDSPAVVSVPSSTSDKDGFDTASRAPSTASEGSADAPQHPPAISASALTPLNESSEEAPAAESDMVGEVNVPEQSPEPKRQGEPAASSQDAATSAGTASGADGAGAWGWSSSWGWGKLREVAADAVKDVAELKESFQQVLADVATADDSDSPTSETQQRQPLLVDKEAEPDTQKKQVILERLEGPDTQLEVGLKAIDDQMEQLATGAAKALNNLWGGLAGMAKGTITAGQSLATKVESATLELAKELVQSVEEGVKDASSGLKGVSKLGGTLASRAERGLEDMGRTAIGLLEEVAGSGPEGALARSGRLQGGATFEESFQRCGGRQAFDELEGLSNECSRLCNRTRARLADKQKPLVDDALAALSPLFDLATPMPVTDGPAASPAPEIASAEPEQPAEGGAKGDATAAVPKETDSAEGASSSAAEAPVSQPSSTEPAAEKAAAEKEQVEGQQEGSAAADASQGPEAAFEQQPQGAAGRAEAPVRGRPVEEQLKREYQPVAELHQAGLRRVEQLLEEARAAADAAAVEMDSSRQTAAPEVSPSAEATEEAASPSSSQAGPSTSTSTAASSSSPQALPPSPGMAIVQGLRREAVLHLAELCATELQLLLRLGRSISAPARYGNPSDDGIQWPPAPEAKAVLLHRVAKRMAADIESAADSFIPALSGVEELVAARLLDEAAAQAAEAAGADLEVDAGSAAARLQEAFRNLMSVVLLSALQSEGLLAA